ncbi:Alpha-glucosides permease MPH3 [Colletotrichum orbiculare MAFF 240422]|uniref:Alpha-glucosides permease MPH3 n=1 Tax=Colletotrichum orbiculare (strain 104-T / ATCC 96160 / CBS 514.97 / LARS 414 / MAFF 240422) TaxID=1213857 RepID=N4VFL6_COLOR|nr:Alpha-glucosides permease MPH3 [Colletotrichum orbiculare MAFF 240422]
MASGKKQKEEADVARIEEVAHVTSVVQKYENDLSHRKTIRAYPYAIVWSIVFATAIIGEGFDLALFGNFFSMVQFKELFGTATPPKGEMEIPAAWQSAILASGQVGQLLGMTLAGKCSVVFGYRKTMMAALASVAFLLLINFFAAEVRLSTGSVAHGLGMISAGEFLLGMPWGTFQACVLPYASDIAPMKLRPALTTFVSMCWIIGQLLSTGAIKASSGIVGDVVKAYHIPVALQWTWPLPVLFFVWKAPESPWWLVREDRRDEAHTVLRRLNRSPDYPAREQVRVLETTNEQEKMETENISYMECFRGANRRRTVIVLMTQVTQQLCGSSLMFYSAKVYQKAGMDMGRSYDLTLVQYALGMVCIAASWWLMGRFGRRTIWLWGIGGISFLMTAVGIMGLFMHAHVALPWMIAALLIIFTGVYNLSVGPLVYAINPEITSTRQKSMTLVLGRFTYLLAGQFNMWLLPRMLEDAPNGWGLGPGAALVYAGLSFGFFVWAYCCLPEVRDRTPAQMDELFRMNTPARKFRHARFGETGAFEISSGNKQV